MAKNQFRKTYKKKKILNDQHKQQIEFEKIKTYEDFFSRVKSNKKYLKSLEYLDNFENDKDNWKFNVKI
jgi:hypothetical protein